MKKLSLLFLSAILLITLAGCGNHSESVTQPVATEAPAYTYSDDPFTNLKNMLKSGDKLFGVAFLGKSEVALDAVQSDLEQQAFIEQVPYVADITNIAENEGNQLFCIVPADETVSVAVYQFGLNEENLPEIGEELISSKEPFLVRGNAEMYVPNLYVVAEQGNRRVEYPLVRSGIEGRLENLDNAMFDFTPYNLLPEFHNLATEEKPLCASWLGDIRDDNDVEFALLLYIHESGEVRFAYGNSETEMQELFIGTWEIDENLLKLRMKGGKPGIGEEVYEKNIDFEWEMFSGMIDLHHVGGDLLMPGTQGETFEFWIND